MSCMSVAYVVFQRFVSIWAAVAAVASVVVFSYRLIAFEYAKFAGDLNVNTNFIIEFVFQIKKNINLMDSMDPF